MAYVTRDPACVAEKDLARTGNPLISNIEKDLARTGVPWVIEPPEEYVCIVDSPDE